MTKIIPLSLATLIVSNSITANEIEKTNLESIVVTANKIEENLQDIPQSITVIHEQEIKERNIENINDIMNYVPNMSINLGSRKFVNFRGLNSSVFTNNNPVVIYIDGIPTTDIYGFDVLTANAKRIEILRGPQGTLYGKDAIGGVVNIVTKEPSNKTHGDILLEYGKNNYTNTLFSINTPLKQDRLYFGLNGQITKEDGWITNTYNNDEKSNKFNEKKYSAYILYKANDKLTAKLSASIFNTKNYGKQGYTKLGNLNLDDFSAKEAENVNFDMPTWSKNKVNSQSLNISYNFENIKLTSVTTNKNLDFKAEDDFDFFTNPYTTGSMFFEHTDKKETTQEFRLSNKTNNGLKWLVGLYFDREKKIQAPYGSDIPSFYFPGQLDRINSESKTISKTSAVFAQTIFPITNKLDLTLGGRFQKISKKIDLDTYYLPVGVQGPAMYTLNDKKSWNTFLPKLALTYKINSNLTAFSSISKGYMPGGYNYAGMMGNSEDNSFEAQKSTNYELGIKGIVNNFIFSASIFRMDIKDIHLFKLINPTTAITDNAKKAHSQGLEFDLTYFVNDNFNISSAIGLNDAKYDDYNEGTRKFDGERIEKTPRYNASISLNYSHPNGLYGTLISKLEGNTNFYDNTQKVFKKRSSFMLADIKLGYKYSNYDIYAYVNNITNEEYIESYAGGMGSSIVTFNEPRNFGIGLKYKF